MRIITDPLGRPIHVPDPSESPDEVLTRMADRDIVAFDVETTGARDDATLRTIQFGTPEESVHLRADRAVHREAVREFLATSNCALTAHNGPFDIGHLHRAGLADAAALWERTIDTLTLDKLLRPGDGREGDRGDSGLSLKVATRAWCGDAATSADAKADLIEWGKTLGLKTIAQVYADCPVDGDPYILYGAADVFDSSALVRVLLPLADAAIGREVVEREHRLAARIHLMVMRGMRVDVEAVRRDEPAIFAEVAGMRASLIERYGIKNPASTQQVIAWFNARGYAIDSSKESVLAKLPLEGEEAAFRGELLTWRGQSKTLSTYFKALSTAAGDSDGARRLHPDLKPLGARTGRMTCSAPNAQNVPAELRPYVVAEPGHTFIGADYNAVEVRVAAGESGDEMLLGAFLRGEDCYEFASGIVWGPPPEAASDRKRWRNQGKPVLLGDIYGRGADSVAADLGTSTDDAKARQRTLRAAMPQLAEHIDGVRAAISAGRTAHRLPSGRVVQVHPLQHFTAGFNTRVQGAARDLLVDATLRLDDAGLGHLLWLPIHDEWLLLVPDDQVPAAMQVLGEAMTTTYGAVPITAEPEVLGKNWRKGS